MKSVIASLFVLIMWISNVWAEGAWNVNGYAFTNVHAWQNGKEVKVSGRVSNGPARSPLLAQIHIENDAGKTRKVKIKIGKFTGQGETFETRFTASKKRPGGGSPGSMLPETNQSKSGQRLRRPKQQTHPPRFHIQKQHHQVHIPLNTKSREP